MKKILIVDDMEEVHKILEPLNRKYQVDNVMSKEEALKMIETNEYDKVITDYHLGYNDTEGGLDVIRAAKKKGLEIISMSREDHEQETLEAGADKFIFKEELFDSIKEIVKNGR